MDINIIIYSIIILITLIPIRKDFIKETKGFSIMWSPPIGGKKKNTFGNTSVAILIFNIIFTLIWGGFFWW